MFKSILVATLLLVTVCSALDAKIASEGITSKNATEETSGGWPCEEEAQGHAALPYKHKCYIPILDSKATYSDAEHFCSTQFHGRLAFVQNPSQVSAIYNYLKALYYPGDLPINDAGSWFVGLKQIDTTDEPKGGWAWLNSDGSINKHSMSSNTPWRRAEPNDYDGLHSENCGALTNDMLNGFGLCDISCHKHLYFLCEVKRNVKM